MGKRKWDKFKTIVILKWFSIGVALGSIFYGMYLLHYPLVMKWGESYQIMEGLLAGDAFAWLFILSGSAKLVSIYFDWKRVRNLALSGMVVLWTLFGVGFLLQFLSGGATNEKWIFLFVIVWTGMGISQRGDSHA